MGSTFSHGISQYLHVKYHVKNHKEQEEEARLIPVKMDVKIVTM